LIKLPDDEMIDPAVALGAQYFDRFADTRVERIGDLDLKFQTPGSMALARPARARAGSPAPSATRPVATASR